MKPTFEVCTSELGLVDKAKRSYFGGVEGGEAAPLLATPNPLKGVRRSKRPYRSTSLVSPFPTSHSTPLTFVGELNV